MSAEPRKRQSLAILALCQVFGMSLWFSASAVLPALQAQYAIGGVQAAALSSSVALGFVAGTLAERGARARRPARIAPVLRRLRHRRRARQCRGDLRRADRRSFRRCCAWSSAPALPASTRSASSMAATWASADLGLLVGLLVARYDARQRGTVPAAAFGGVDWRHAVIGASGLAVLAAVAHSRFRARPAPPPRHARSAPATCSTPGGSGRCGSPISAITATCGSSMRCGRGSRPSSRQASRVSPPRSRAPFWAKLAAFATIGVGASAASPAASSPTAAAARR